MSCVLNAFIKFPVMNIGKYNLRKINMDDYNDIFEIYSDYENIKYEGMKTLTALDQAKDYINSISNGFNDRIFIRWCIEEQNSKKVIGLIALHHIDYENSKVQIGYILNRKYWKMGIMYGCIKEIINYLINEERIHRIDAMIYPQNISSINLVKKIGFTQERLLTGYAYNPISNKYEDRYLYVLLGYVYRSNIPKKSNNSGKSGWK